MNTVILDDEQMCCCKCGHIAEIGDAYKTDYESDEKWPICPKCGNTNTGGYPCYAAAMYWQEEDLDYIIEINREV